MPSTNDMSPVSTPELSSPELDDVHVCRHRTKGEARLLCPLAIKFSQLRVRPNFQDGREVDDASALVTPVPFEKAWLTPPEDDPEQPAELPPYLEDQYDEFLAHPFPTIEVIRFRSKLRTLDQNGKEELGEEHWYTLDNRRLYALQKAAVHVWPKRCCVLVRVLVGDYGHALRKFKTQTQGRTVEIGHRFWGDESKENTVWAWEGAVECLTEDYDFKDEQLNRAAIARDEARPHDDAMVRAGGCANVLEQPEFKDKANHIPVPVRKVQEQGSKSSANSSLTGLMNLISDFKLPPASKKHSPAAQDGGYAKRYPKKNATGQSATTSPDPATKQKQTKIPTKQIQITTAGGKIGATERANQGSTSPGGNEQSKVMVMDLLSVMKKKPAAVSGGDHSDSDTTASSGSESSPKKNNQSSWDQKSQQQGGKRRQRGGGRNAGGRGWGQQSLDQSGVVTICA